MIFLNKTSKKISFITNNLIYNIKLFNDFIFFTYLIKEYIKFHNLYSIDILKNSIYLLNMLSIKHILFNLYNDILYKNNYIYCNNIYILELFYWKNKSFISYTTRNIYNIEQKILLIKKISRTRSKGRIRRYKVIVLIGNKSGWFGIGFSKDYYLQNAISKARVHAFKNIYQIPIFYSNILKTNIYIEKKFKKFYLFSSNFRIKKAAHYVLRVLFDFVGITNISSKIIGIHNIYNILFLILKI